MPENDTLDNSEDLQPYKLRMPHMHGGQIHPAGTVLTLSADQIERVRSAEESVLTQTTQELTNG